eukprot:CAMPEP_0184739214 /NCGR_PEP_ID=MMETSP0315-20130426/2046_1 /TAXON_ID=101924 /ORGANISM="Rhodosorus marinus, Strain UTEX LB 2760" /LENGTH=678 /DNA_ID=CAMNT_0027207775 /DNA_START=232 /DNA_END=2268 /DNA_ORIENTATION=-
MGRLSFICSGSGPTNGVPRKAATSHCSRRGLGLARGLNVREQGRICIGESRSRSLVVVSGVVDASSQEDQSHTRKRVIARKFLLRRWLSILRIGLALGLILLVTALATSSGKPVLATTIVALLFLNVLIYVAPSKPGLIHGESPRSLLPPSSAVQPSDRESFLERSAQALEQPSGGERIAQQSVRLEESSRESASAGLPATRDLYVDTLKADLNELSRVIDSQRMFLAGLEDKVSELTAVRDRMEDQNRQLAAENQRLLEALNQRTRRLQDLEETNAIYKIKDRQREDDFTKTEKTAQGLNVDNQQLQIEKKRLLEINSDLRRQLDELNRSLSSWVRTPAPGVVDHVDQSPPQKSNNTIDTSDNQPSEVDSVGDPLTVGDDEAEKARAAGDDQPEPIIADEDVALKVSEERLTPPREMESSPAEQAETGTPTMEGSPQGGRRPIDNPYSFSRAEFDSTPAPPVPDSDEREKVHSLSSLQGARALIQEAKAVGGSQATPLFQQAVKMLEDVERQFPDDRNVIWELGTCLLAWGKSNPGGKYADDILSEAGERFRDLSRRDANDEGCFFNWGLSLCVRAAQKPMRTSLELYDSASGKYERAVQINPKSRISWFNYGLAIMSRARCMESAADKPPVEDLIYYYEQAMIRFERAIDLDSSDWKAREYRRICRETLLKYSRNP